MSANLDLIKKRTAIKNVVQVMKEVCDEHSPTTPLSIEYVKILLEDLTDQKCKFDTIQDEMLEYCEDAAAEETQHKESAVFHAVVRKLRSELLKIQKTLECSAGSTTNISNSTALAIKEELTDALAAVDSHSTSPLTLPFISAYLNQLKEIRSQIRLIQPDLTTVGQNQTIVQQPLLIDIKSMAFTLEAKLTEIQSALDSNTNSSSRNTSTVKLPQIDLPVFDGKFENWLSFKDLFSAIVDNNNNLTGAQKLQYLKSSLKGEAAGLIKLLQTTDQNYPRAWTLVNERFENKREILTSVLKKLTTQPSVTKESPELLQQLVDTTNECRDAIEILQRTDNLGEDLLVLFVVERLDPESRRRWATSLVDSEIPTFQKLLDFLKQHIRGLTSSQPISKFPNSIKVNDKHGKKSAFSHHGATELNCQICSGNHYLNKCEKFLAESVEARNRIIQSKKLCFNCFKSHHLRDCKSNYRCRACKGKHHTLLHKQGPVSTGQKSQTINQPNTSTTTSLFTNDGGEGTRILLATALVKVVDNTGHSRDCRLLVDGGSQASFISEQCVSSLGLKRTKDDVVITGIGSTTAVTSRGLVQVNLVSRIDNSILSVQARILGRVTGTLPNFDCPTTKWDHLRGLKLADPYYYKTGPIDILLGADYAASIMRQGIKTGFFNSPTAQNTIFGWILSGPVSSGSFNSIQAHLAHYETDSLLRRFWELEEVPSIKHLTSDEKICEDHFQETHRRNSDGRYVVELPLKANVSNLGYSRQSALSRLHQVEKRLERQPLIKEQYHNFMKEFLDLNHMELIYQDSIQKAVGEFYYLPHHCVVKESSTTTKLRVVFDGSAKTSTGLSLNDCLRVGPTIQDELYTLLLRFRAHQIALKADITKMYRQFEVAEHHQDYQRILWRTSFDQPIQDYRILRVTYGTASAPYLATKCLQQLAHDEKLNYPVASKLLAKDLYVDDLLTGSSPARDAKKIVMDLTTLVKSGGMEFCKWATNSPTVLSSIPVELRESALPLSIDQDSMVKALGVQWHPAIDCFTFKFTKHDLTAPITKRVVLSELAKVFDPLGFITPTTIMAKIIFQDLWKLDLSWDSELPQDMLDRWKEYISQLHMVESINIPRFISSSSTIKQELHGFCDASEKAYAAVVYMKNIQSDGSVITRIITSKTKVAPIKQVSLPRLELCGAVLLAKLLMAVRTAINFQHDVHAWTDSTIVLKWLAAFPSRWKTFVANRVAEIQGLLSVENWHHVQSEYNPADCASRGISASELNNFSLWWNGPEFLKLNQIPIFNQSNLDIEQVLVEQKLKQVLVHEAEIKWSLVDKFSNLGKLKRVTDYVLRFINNCRKANEKRRGFLTTKELDDGLLIWIREAQLSEFAEEIKELKKHSTVKSSSKLISLNPFLDSTGVVRVGGRLQNASTSEALRHPIILPHHSVTNLIISHFHLSNLHAGPQLLLATLRNQYWILRAKDAVRKVTRNCIICKRQSAITVSQLMGSLPSARVTPGRAFLNTGVDFAGPFDLKVLKGRGCKSFKAYICLFVCFSIKAVHLEAVSDLSSDAFIAALKRFVSRRGLPVNLYSDCGTNFVGADRELTQFLNSTEYNSTQSQFCSSKGITWHFNPPGAPHHGGLWEAGVKSTKYHLKRVVGSSVLNFEDFQTLLCQIESCLNSRPLCAMSNNPNDLSVLTPGHFLIGEPLNAIPEPDLTSITMNRLSRWQSVQQMMQHFWRRWSSEYVTSLQQRFKWTAKRDNLKINDLVLIKDEQLPPLKWKMGRVIQIHPGKDNCVRVVTLKTASGEFKRPVVKLCPIIQDN